MAESVDRDSKTEEPTEKKIRDSIEKGQLPHSKEAPILASFAAILIFTVFFARDSVVELSGFLSTFLEKPEDWPIDTEVDVIGLMRIVFLEIGKAVAALLILLVAAGVTASVFQHVPSFVIDRIAPKMSRISIREGWNRLFGVRGLVEFLKSVGKLAFALLFIMFAVNGVQHRLLLGMITQPTAFAMVIREVAINVLLALTFAMVIIGAADIVWSRFSWRRDLRMTRQEVKDELKQSDGDPIIKSRMRSLARDRARRRMMAAVPRATLVIANPTHYSIALKYVREEDAAPVVLAKGVDIVAVRIREIATANGIPIFEDVALARSMYKQVSVDSVIPPQFYQAVAELVRIVNTKKGGPKPMQAKS
jgi:flagellar biosynthesis protein FlhB